MIGAAVGAGLKVAGAIAGGISNARKMKKVRRNLRDQIKENQEWFDRRYNEDSTQRADAQRALTQMKETMRDRNRATKGANAVMGGTNETLAAEKAASNQAVADTMSQIAVNGEQRKDAIEDSYRSRKADLQQQMNSAIMGSAAQTSQAIQGVASAGADIAGVLSTPTNIVKQNSSPIVQTPPSASHISYNNGSSLANDMSKVFKKQIMSGSTKDRIKEKKPEEAKIASNTEAKVVKEKIVDEVKPESHPDDGWSWEKFERETNPNRPEVISPEEQQKRNRRDKARKILSAIGDGVGSIANLWSTIEGAPNAYDPSSNMTRRYKDLKDKLEAEDKARGDKFHVAIQTAKYRDRQLAKEREQRRYERSYDAKTLQQKKDEFDYKRQQDENKAKADAIKTGFEAQKWVAEQKERERHNRAMEGAKAQQAGDRTAKSIARQKYNVRGGAALSFNNGLGLDIKIYPSVLKYSLPTLYNDLIEEAATNKNIKLGTMDTINIKTPTENEMLAILQRNWANSPRTVSRLKEMAKYDPAEGIGGESDDDDDTIPGLSVESDDDNTAPSLRRKK